MNLLNVTVLALLSLQNDFMALAALDKPLNSTTYTNSTISPVSKISASAIGKSPQGTINLINGTPYNWKLVNMHEYQMYWWYPDIIPAGGSFESDVKFRNNGHKDDAAEAHFILEGAPKPMSFTLQARSNPPRVEVIYHDALSSINNPENSKHDIGFEDDGSCTFMLAGDGDFQPFTSSNPPVAWMQATFEDIEHLTLREVVQPASHDSGVDILSHKDGGIKHNTLTQTVPIYEQLKAGARFFDIRPLYRKGKMWTAHMSLFSGNKVIGGVGRSIEEIVNDVNRFTREFPGELLTLSLSHDMNRDTGYSNFEHEQWNILFEELLRIEALFEPIHSVVHDVDLTTLPINHFISPGSRSAVVVRTPAGEHLEIIKKKPHAFVHYNRYPISGSWSDAQSLQFLAEDQLRKLKEWDHKNLLQSTWTITQNLAYVIDVGNPRHSIIHLAKRAKKALFAHLWPTLTTSMFPNIIEVDDYKDGKVTALCMAINRKFAGKEY